MPHVSNDPFRVLYVCQANRCRSAIAELLLRDRLTSAVDDPRWIEVSSAGVAATSDRPIHPLAGDLLLRQGIDSTGFTSRRLTAARIEAADLILTAERVHRSAVLGLVPDAIDRSFTMRQFARLTQPPVDAHPDAAELIADALGHRGLRAVVDPVDDDIADPVGGPPRKFRKTFEEIEATLSVFGVAHRRQRGRLSRVLSR